MVDINVEFRSNSVWRLVFAYLLTKSCLAISEPDFSDALRGSYRSFKTIEINDNIVISQ